MLLIITCTKVEQAALQQVVLGLTAESSWLACVNNKTGMSDTATAEQLRAEQATLRTVYALSIHNVKVLIAYQIK